MKRTLGVEDPPGKDSYQKLKDYLLILFERVGHIIRSIKEEPYIIKNCLYLLEKIDSIPTYKQQADELISHMTDLKEEFTSAVDMRTILDRQIAIIASKKNDLPVKPQRQEDPKKQPNQAEAPTVLS